VFAVGADTKTIDITPTSDGTDEVDETVILTIGTPINATKQIWNQQHTTTITDDDGPQAELVIKAPVIAGLSPAVGEGLAAATFEVHLKDASGNATTSVQPVTVNVAYNGDQVFGFPGAQIGVDYNANVPTSITVPAGNQMVVAGTGLLATNDALSEGAEFITLNLTAVNGTLATAQTFIAVLDDDRVPEVTLTKSDVSTAEKGGVTTFTATLNEPWAGTSNIGLAFSGSAVLNTDYTRSANFVILTAGQSSGSVTVTRTDDALDEAEETIIVDVDAPSTGVVENPQQQVTAVITDDDIPPVVKLTRDNAAIAENGGTSTYTATLDAVSGQAVSVEVQVGGLPTTATLNTDFSTTSTTLNIPAGSTTAPFTVTSTDDALDEVDETLVVVISSATKATPWVLNNPTQEQIDAAIADITTTITDDDLPPTVSLTFSNPTVKEDGTDTSTLTATLAGPSGKDVVVKLKTPTGTGSFEVVTFNVDAVPDLSKPNSNFSVDLATATMSFNIPAGQTGGNVTWVGVPDIIFESSTNENLTVAVDGATSQNVTVNGTSMATIEIVDDDSAPTISLSASKSKFSEKDGNSILMATLSNPSHESITVAINRDDKIGTAQTGLDYSQMASGITIGAGASAENILVLAIDDQLYEGDETIVVSLGDVTTGVASVPKVAATVLTIEEDEKAPAK